MKGTQSMRYLFSVAVLFLSLLSCTVLAEAETTEHRIDFSQAKQEGKAVTGWTYKGKFGTRAAKFDIVNLDGTRVLRLASDKGTGTLLHDIARIDLSKYRWMRWKWRVAALPRNADGTVPARDDQAIGIYIGTGSTFSQESVAFRWETRTPKETTGKVKYAMGALQVHWICVRNESDGLNKWYVDECNIYDILYKYFNGKVPSKDIALSLSANSQYTGSSSVAYLEYIEFSEKPLLPEPTVKCK